MTDHEGFDETLEKGTPQKPVTHRHHRQGSSGQHLPRAAVDAAPIIAVSPEFGNMIKTIIDDNGLGIIRVVGENGQIAIVYAVSEERLRDYQTAMQFTMQAAGVLKDNGII